jgi:hypothetical protein
VRAVDIDRAPIRRRARLVHRTQPGAEGVERMTTQIEITNGSEIVVTIELSDERAKAWFDPELGPDLAGKAIEVAMVKFSRAVSPVVHRSVLEEVDQLHARRASTADIVRALTRVLTILFNARLPPSVAIDIGPGWASETTAPS